MKAINTEYKGYLFRSPGTNIEALRQKYKQAIKIMPEIHISHQQLEDIIEALNEKITRHEGIARRTKESGFGKASTLAKADKHQGIADYYGSIISEISGL